MSFSDDLERYSAIAQVVWGVLLLRLSENKKKAAIGSASIAAILVVLRHVLSRRRSKFISDYSQLAQEAKPAADNSSYAFDEYDVIIVGGGTTRTSGCVLASRLSEDPSLRVLLLEAGGSGRDLILTRIPLAYPLLFHTKHVFQFHTTPQESAGGHKRFWPRAKMLGGCSSINAQMAQYGSPSDFDEWATITRDDSYNWDQFGSYFRKFERYAPDARYPNVNLSLRGSQGPVQVGYFNTTSKVSDAFVDTCPKVGIPHIADFNTVTGTKGVSRNGERVTTEGAYLTSDVLARPNLKVAVYATVTKLTLEKTQGGARAVGVEFATHENGPRYRARARKEVIVSGGAIHSPQILMLSGVGPADHLKQHGIAVVHDLPGVGERLTDHPVVDIRFKDKVGLSTNFIKPAKISHLRPWKLITSVYEYVVKGKGPLASNLGESACFIRSDDPSLYPPETFPEKIEDSTSGPDGPDIEIVTTPMAYKEHTYIVLPELHTFGMHIVLLRPTSYGSLRLSSANPWDHPIMDPKYCSTQHDVDVLVRGIKTGLKIARTEPLASMLDENDKHEELDHALHLKSDTELAHIARERVETLYHPACSCRMAPLEEGGVVDSRFKVYGTTNLRVCDASVFPSIVSGHTAAACIALAEKLADVIKAEYKSSY
ncbi:hypothetical protein HWV62_2328 [Athelia sp. TMB]|nr:hypothetical protein HWV62_2328 [Athelia sp. TMB]